MRPYSIIHLQPAELSRAFSEIHRVLRPGALFLVAFHIGSEVRHLAEWLGHEVDMDFHFLEQSDIAKAAEECGELHNDLWYGGDRHSDRMASRAERRIVSPWFPGRTVTWCGF